MPDNEVEPVDLVLIDEAASIPLPLLESFIKQHSRMIFATTEHGYEGSGRGFALRFKKILNEFCPQWKSARLETPCHMPLRTLAETMQTLLGRHRY